MNYIIKHDENISVFEFGGKADSLLKLTKNNIMCLSFSFCLLMLIRHF